MGNILETKLPVAKLVEKLTEWLTHTFSGVFNFLQTIGSYIMDWITNVLLFINPLLFIVLVTAAVFFLAKKKWPLATFTFLGLLFIYNQGLWEHLINTFTLVLVASLISIIIGIPLGIWMAKSTTVRQIVNPILDFMQTMPAFVYLIPAVAFFGIGMVPGVFASVIFALPPTVRFTNLGISNISTELVEASDAFGSTPRQKLLKVELPLAKNTIMAGINQTMMLALSMVVTGSMIGAPGLGREVLSALKHADVGTGIEPGAGITTATQKTLKAYPNLSDWELVLSSTGAMTTSLDQAIKNKEEIVVTGWSPHWMFSKYDLKYLKDPKKTLGSEENINSIARKGLKKDMPKLYKIVDKFYWTTADMESVMLDMNNGMKPEDAAKKWVKANQDKVKKWIN
ncbi:ABC transporter permease/substrate binding protein [Streptococcus pseudoporcinus]|uniref:Glycine-betaine binding permease n=1 Tax=Streptococcus pseudoporcinus TaxID=361101 RepID=A0A4U9YER2_9STRE|nr:ABC transporter permease/substrate binding protein [Streptococcus pseudoporcinus]VTS25113.1 glycine-betaine binding permease [Streptococcus pseudoporcinus]VUC71267.1 glycine-betaine binding permease [Streptococcus pseudoporcinus]VUD00754.1 glycine-betaine binding permease [Streptococcus pseudoporcinus]VUD01096.1 glycine-betaine binding permease [Streptococcus pseudoporcinus]